MLIRRAHDIATLAGLAAISLLFFSQAAHAGCEHVPLPWGHAFSELCGEEVTQSKHIPDFVKKLSAINREVNRVKYSDPDEAYGFNYWETPSEFYSGGGICREYAVAKYYRLAKLGIAEADMRVDIMRLKTGEDHAVLEMQYEGRVYVLDSRNNVIHGIAYLADMEMLGAVNRFHVWGVNPKYAAK